MEIPGKRILKKINWKSILLTNFSMFLVHFRYRECEWRDKASTHLVHAISNPRIRERISFQSLLDQKETHWNCPCFVSDRATDQDLVPESSNEVEEGTQNGVHEYCPLSHVSLWTSISIWYSSVTICASECIGRVAQFFGYWLETQSAISRTISRISE
jgi:hypothetical protein